MRNRCRAWIYVDDNRRDCIPADPPYCINRQRCIYAKSTFYAFCCGHYRDCRKLFLGTVDMALGTKKTCVFYGIWYIVAIGFLLLQLHGAAFVWISVVMVGIGIGGIGNLIPSMIGTCFGRYDYLQANRAIAPLNTIVRQSGIILGGILSQTVYGYTGLYVILFIADAIGIIMTIFLIKPALQEK